MLLLFFHHIYLEMLKADVFPYLKNVKLYRNVTVQESKCKPTTQMIFWLVICYCIFSSMVIDIFTYLLNVHTLDYNNLSWSIYATISIIPIQIDLSRIAFVLAATYALVVWWNLSPSSLSKFCQVQEKSLLQLGFAKLSPFWISFNRRLLLCVSLSVILRLRFQQCVTFSSHFLPHRLQFAAHVLDLFSFESISLTPLSSSSVCSTLWFYCLRSPSVRSIRKKILFFRRRSSKL
jgi:hypothetical protein